MDRLDHKHRSWNMSRVHGKNTKPELIVRKYLYANGVRYRLHAKLPGRPDIIVRKKKLAIFVNGCFWHAHDCKRFSWPQTNVEFWKDKIESNAARDNKNYAQLKAEGWRVFVIWQCQIKNDIDTALEEVLNECHV